MERIVTGAGPGPRAARRRMSVGRAGPAAGALLGAVLLAGGLQAQPGQGGFRLDRPAPDGCWDLVLDTGLRVALPCLSGPPVVETVAPGPDGQVLVVRYRLAPPGSGPLGEGVDAAVVDAQSGAVLADALPWDQPEGAALWEWEADLLSVKPRTGAPRRVPLPPAPAPPNFADHLVTPQPAPTGLAPPEGLLPDGNWPAETNFAGTARLAIVECGTGCLSGAVEDWQTGEAVALGFTIEAVAGQPQPALDFRPESRLLVATGWRDGRERGQFRYLWTGAELVPLAERADPRAARAVADVWGGAGLDWSYMRAGGLVDEMRAALDRPGALAEGMFHARFDLTGDGVEDWIVTGAGACQARACPMAVLSGPRGALRLLGQAETAGVPVLAPNGAATRLIRYAPAEGPPRPILFGPVSEGGAWDDLGPATGVAAAAWPAFPGE